MSIQALGEQRWKIRWREGGHQRSLSVCGPYELAKKIERKKLSLRDENRHLDVKQEVYFPMSALLDRYEQQYARKKRSYDRERGILKGIRQAFRGCFVSEIDGAAVERWYHDLTMIQGLSASTALRHFNVLHHLFGRATTVWTKDTGLSRNPADEVEVERPDDSRDRFLTEEEIPRLKRSLDLVAFGAVVAPGSRPAKVISWDHYRMRLIVLTSWTTGMREGEVFRLSWSDLDSSQRLMAVRAHLKGGKTRYVPMSPELAAEFRRFPAVLGEKRIFPPKPGAKSGRQRVDRSFKAALRMAGIEGFRFHDLRHTFASWYMMNGGDLYELAKILGHANIKMTERYAKLAKKHISKTGQTAQEMWRMMESRGAAGSEEAL